MRWAQEASCIKWAVSWSWTDIRFEWNVPLESRKAAYLGFEIHTSLFCNCESRSELPQTVLCNYLEECNRSFCLCPPPPPPPILQYSQFSFPPSSLRPRWWSERPSSGAERQIRLLLSIDFYLFIYLNLLSQRCALHLTSRLCVLQAARSYTHCFSYYILYTVYLLCCCCLWSVTISD